jgi:hypothetical protein
VFRAALAGLLTSGIASSGLAAPAPAAAAPAPAKETDPLVVHLDTISPELPRSGDVEITGTVTNVSDETFTRVNLHAFSSRAPILDAVNLAASTAVDPSVSVGERVTVPGTFDTVDELAPGESADFSDSVPVELFETTGQPGVYWIGIHALGDTEAVPRDGVADGRARTFIPMRPTGGRSQQASVILPIRNRVWFDEDGAVAGTERWARRLEEGGSLDGVLDMAESAGSTPYSWLVDPAVLFAIARISQGNVPRTLDPDPSVPGQEPTPTDTPTEGTSEGTETPDTVDPLTPSGSTPAEEPSEDEADLAEAATAWLDRFKALVGATPVMTLPYGDIDVSAAVRHDRTRLEQAVTRGAEIMAALAVPSQPAVAPVGDRLSPEAIAQVPSDILVLLGDNAFAIPPDGPGSVVEVLGHKVLVTSSGAEAGGPAPTAANDPLALRQRLLSEAALRLNDRDTSPLVVTLPTMWRGEDADAFFSDLERSWLEVVPVGDVAAEPATTVDASSIVYTPEDVDAELDAASFAAVTRATDASTLMEQVLSSVTRVETQVRDEVLVTLSEQHRARPGLARGAAGRVEDSLRDDLGRIEVEVPTAVTLSSDSGPLGATLVNGLDQPVEVTLQVRTDGELTLSGDSTRQLGPGARSVVRFRASTSQGGVHNVRLTVTSVDGVPLGASGQLPIRAARVSALIWIVMAAGAVVLFGMIGYRLPGQVRARRAQLAAEEHAEHLDEPVTEPTDEPAAEPGPGPTTPVAGRP